MGAPDTSQLRRARIFAVLANVAGAGGARPPPIHKPQASVADHAATCARHRRDHASGYRSETARDLRVGYNLGEVEVARIIVVESDTMPHQPVAALIKSSRPPRKPLPFRLAKWKLSLKASVGWANGECTRVAVHWAGNSSKDDVSAIVS